MENEYKFALFDASYFLTRVFMIAKGQEDLTVDDLVRMFFYQIAKFKRDYHSCDKIILAWDKWSPDIQGYYRSELISGYKGTRHYYNEDELEELKEDDSLSEEEKKAAVEAYEKELKLSKLKQGAKRKIIDTLGRFGMPSFFKGGYEADDIAKVFCDYIKENFDENDTRKSCIVTVDSDWSYLINENVDFCNGKTGNVTTFDEMNEQEEHIPEKLGISLFKFKAYIDSLYSSHNDMIGAANKETTMCQPHDVVIGSIMKGEDKFIEDKDLFLANMSTFDLEKLPEFDKLKNMMYYIDKKGLISPKEEFANFSLINGLQIRESYYSNFAVDLNRNFYKQL